MASKTWVTAAVAAFVLTTSLAACNRNQSGSAQRDGGTATTDRSGSPLGDRSYNRGDYRSPGSGGESRYARSDRDDAPREATPMFHGEPMWSESRTHSAKENAEYHFERAGADLGSKTLDDFLTKVHRFGDNPPAGALHIERANGDKLLYDPKDNIFAVFTREGAPRTIFKPSSGMDYWEEQKVREADRSGDGGYRSRSYRRADDSADSGSRYSRDTRADRSE